LEEFVGVGEECIGLQRPHFKHISNLIMVKTLLLLKLPCVKRVTPHHHALAAKIMMSSSKIGCFAPPRKKLWKLRGGIGYPSYHQFLPSMISLIQHAGP
jgi:hypothetical protein